MKRFHLVAYSNDLSDPIPAAFKVACDDLGIDLCLYSEHDTLPSKGLGADDGLYRASTSKRGRVMEQYLISPDCVHFYDSWQQAVMSRSASYFVHRKLGLPVIPTYPVLPLTDADTAACLQQLGSFPLILKVRGGTHGVGIIRVDSLDSFKTVRDYLLANDANAFVRSYIPHEYYVRAIVVGDRLVSAHAAYAVEGEFRTNSDSISNQQRTIYEAPTDIERMIVKAVRSLKLHFGGVDLLAAPDGTLHIAEVNFPCQFDVTQRATGVDIARAMIEYLMHRHTESEVMR